MSSYETGGTMSQPTKRMLTLLKTMKERGDFHLEGDDTREDVIARCELLERVLEKLDKIAPQIVSTYRNILEENGITTEQTGKISWVVVGGRVHGESLLKTWSDIDSVFTAEKPFLFERKLYLTEEEQVTLPKEIDTSARRTIQQRLVTALKSEILPRLSEMVGHDLQEAGILEIKGYGHQRNQDIADGLVIFTEP